MKKIVAYYDSFRDLVKESGLKKGQRVRCCISSVVTDALVKDLLFLYAGSPCRIESTGFNTLLVFTA